MKNTSRAVAVFCPECGSASIAKAVAAGVAIDLGANTQYKCGSCSWEGPKSEVIAVPFSHAFGDDEGIIQAMMGDLRKVMAKTFAPTFLPFLLKWGFMEQPVDVKSATRWIAVVAHGVLTSVLEERKRVAEEHKQDG